VTIFEPTTERLNQGLDYVLSKLPPDHQAAYRKKYDRLEGNHSRAKLLNFVREMAYAGQVGMDLVSDPTLAGILNAEEYQR
jgi:hypothetical protein